MKDVKIQIIIFLVLSLLAMSLRFQCEKEKLQSEAKKTSDSLLVYHKVYENQKDLQARIDSISNKSIIQNINNYYKTYHYEINNADSLSFDSLSILLRADIQIYEPRQYRSIKDEESVY